MIDNPNEKNSDRADKNKQNSDFILIINFWLKYTSFNIPYQLNKNNLK
jgi:chloramphenicol O-acetyltransferase